MLEIIYILFTFTLFFLSIRMAGLVPFPTGLIFILGGSQIALALEHGGAVYYGMVAVFDYGGIKQNYAFTEIIYSIAALLALLMVVGKFKLIKGIKLDAEALKVILKTGGLRRMVSIAVILLVAHLSLFMILADWKKLWFYQIYLQSIVDNDMAQLFGVEFTSTVMRTTPFWGISSALCVCLLTESRSPFLKSITWITSLCYFLILLSSHSRTAAFVPGLMAVYYTVLRPKGRGIIMPVMWIMTILALTSALAGRSTSEHGLSAIPFSLVRPFVDTGGVDISQIILNFFEGVFVTAESFQIKGNFPTLYKILSYSPLPSLIDGFSLIQAKSEHRLHDYVPMSGVGEAVNFGWWYVVLLIGVVTLIVRTHLRLAKDSPVIFLTCNFLIMFSTYLLFSYPLRNALRFGWLAFAISLLVMAFRRRHVTAALTAPHDDEKDSPTAERVGTPAFRWRGHSRKNPERHKCFK